MYVMYSTRVCMLCDLGTVLCMQDGSSWYNLTKNFFVYGALLVLDRRHRAC